jgi:hypothetical protein
MHFSNYFSVDSRQVVTFPSVLGELVDSQPENDPQRGAGNDTQDDEPRAQTDPSEPVKAEACPRPLSGLGRKSVFVVVLRSDATNDDTATRCLRAFLKAALRSWGLRCVSCERAADEATGGQE